MSEWISVKDRLPEQCDDVLIYRNDRFEIVMGYQISQHKILVDYWMYLPEPPKEEKARLYIAPAQEPLMYSEEDMRKMKEES